MEERSVLEATEIRQGVMSHNVRFVMIASLMLVVAAFVGVTLLMA
jgi:hypothetical protein